MYGRIVWPRALAELGHSNLQKTKHLTQEEAGLYESNPDREACISGKNSAPQHIQARPLEVMITGSKGFVYNHVYAKLLEGGVTQVPRV